MAALSEDRQRELIYQLFKSCITSRCLLGAAPWSPVEPQTNNGAVIPEKTKVKLSSAEGELSPDSAVHLQMLPLIQLSTSVREEMGEEGVRLCFIADEMKMTLSSSRFCFEQCCIPLGDGLGFH